MSDEFNEVKQRVLQLCPPWPVDTVGRAVALLNDTAVQKLTGLPQAIFETTLTALLQQASQGAAGGSADVASFADRFRQLLLKSHITHPLQEILEVIARRLSSRMIVCESPAAALELYEDAKLIPGASTCGHLMTQHGVRVNGPFFTRGTDGPASLLMGSDPTGRPCIIKMLPAHPAAARNGQPGGSEAAAWRVIQNAPAAQQILPIVPAQILELNLNPERSKFMGYAPGTYAALQMPHYCGSVASLLQFPEAAVVSGGLRMQSALSHIHSLGLVHMDVKADNIFVDMEGVWWLGDFGSAISTGEQVFSTTTWFSSSNLIGTPARAEHDWFMLAVTLVCELHKDTWRAQLGLDKERHVMRNKLKEVVAAIGSETPRNLLWSILQKAGL